MKNERHYWERNAARYDKAMRLLGGPLPLAKELSARAVDGLGEVLEVASGTGLFAEVLAPRVERLVATAYAEAMVEQTRKRVEAAGLANVRCEVEDLEALPYEAGAFGPRGNARRSASMTTPARRGPARSRRSCRRQEPPLVRSPCA